jgi:hypothetical protein
LKQINQSYTSGILQTLKRSSKFNFDEIDANQIDSLPMSGNLHVATHSVFSGFSNAKNYPICPDSKERLKI